MSIFEYLWHRVAAPFVRMGARYIILDELASSEGTALALYYRTHLSNRSLNREIPQLLLEGLIRADLIPSDPPGNTAEMLSITPQGRAWLQRWDHPRLG